MKPELDEGSFGQVVCVSLGQVLREYQRIRAMFLTWNFWGEKRREGMRE